jgi:hypothetical protein
VVRVPWDRLTAESPKASEALVAMLVLRLRERAGPVDGSGGDGGRDLFEYTGREKITSAEWHTIEGGLRCGKLPTD